MARRDADTEHPVDIGSNDELKVSKKDNIVIPDDLILKSNHGKKIAKEISGDEEIVLMPFESIAISHSAEFIERIFKDEFERGLVQWRK